MRLVPLLVLALALTACGSAAEQTGVPASSGVESVPAEPAETTTPEVDESLTEPPPILLASPVGEQEAVQGSYCVSYEDPASGQGSGACADMAGPIYPKVVTSVAGGDRITFVLPEATFRQDSVVTIRRLGCNDDHAIREIELKPGMGEQGWVVDLEHGTYQLDVFVRFEAEDGRTGDVSGTLGLTVAGPKKYDALGVTGIKRAMQVCPFGD